MLEDDIQYLGTISAQRPRLTAPNCPFPAAQRRVTGITLHVEQSSAEPAVYDMMFRSSNTNVVHIGRRPGTDVEKRQRDNELGKAMFRCAVVSRKHAKIAFSDSGLVYLIDLNSHHGTHVRKPGQTVSRMIKPEMPTLLDDGDTITFGKSVGRNNELVRPVVARVELIYGPPSSIISPRGLLKPLLVPNSKRGSSEFSDWSKSPSKQSSGRYGVYVPSSSSSDISSPISVQDSDIEELPGSPAPAKSVSGPQRDQPFSHVGRAIEALKHLLPPIHSPSGSRRDSPSVRPFPSDLPECDPRTPSPFNSPSPLSSFGFGRPSTGTNPIDLDAYSPVAFDAYSNDVFEGITSNRKSRSASPMDLSSPSPPASNPAADEPAANEPIIIGAWPGSRASSLSSAEPLNDFFPPLTPPPVDLPAPVESKALSPASNEAVASDSRPMSAFSHEERAVSPEEAPVVAPEPITTPVDPTPPAPKPDNSAEIVELKSALESIRAELAKLQAHRRKYKSRFNANVHIIADKLTDLDDRITDVNGLCTTLADQLDTVTEFDIPDLHAQVTHVEALQEKNDTATRSVQDRVASDALVGETEEAKKQVVVLRDLVTEMTTLCDTTKAQIDTELELVKAARADALEAIAAQVQTAALTSLKRKRSEDDDGVDLIVDYPTGKGTDIASASALTTILTPTTVAGSGGIDIPPPKRARRVVSAVAQTATAITIGAIATWSALAFS